MKKLFDVFGKGRRRKENFDTVCCLSNVREDHSSPGVVFKPYQFDSNCCNACEFSPQDRDAPRNGSHDAPLHVPLSLASDAQEKKGPETEGSLLPKHGLHPAREQKQSFTGERSEPRRNMYAIQISNSKSFHIGSQKTINIYGMRPPRNDALPCTEDGSSGSEVDFNRLLNREEKLSEDNIVHISLHLGEKWKDFGRNLGLEEAFLEEQEFRNGPNTTLIAYDILRNYVTRFPDTSFGFVVNVLCEIHQVRLVEQLAQELKTSLADSSRSVTS